MSNKIELPEQKLKFGDEVMYLACNGSSVHVNKMTITGIQYDTKSEKYLYGNGRVEMPEERLHLTLKDLQEYHAQKIKESYDELQAYSNYERGFKK